MKQVNCPVAQSNNQPVVQPNNYPIPPSHRTFQFGSVIIDSNFDSGNCSHAQKVSSTSYNLWIGTDHVKNNYRTWFHFSIQGLNKGTIVSFKIKNMQNQSRLLNQGLVPVFRQNDSNDWKRIRDKINLSSIQFNDGWIQWSFKHTMTSNEKVFFAFFYPWSNQENDKFLTAIEQRCKHIDSIYFHRTAITTSLQGRPIQFLTISSKKGLLNKVEQIDDKNLFTDKSKPKAFNKDKKGFVIGARVHPGEVPGSHVMTGIIDQITKDTQMGNIIRDKLVFYIFPIFNPDGVARGHYRVDTNGINLNRCYINPHPKQHSAIYAVKKWVLHLHQNNRYFGLLDLHAHASRKGMFIYGNATNQLEKQIDTCLLPKILSMNSQNFQYQGSNFTEKNMYVKDRGDHMSKEGAGRVAIFKATKNAFSWTLQCNYNCNKITNILQPKKSSTQQKITINQSELDSQIIVPYKNPLTKPTTQFYTIETYRQVGKQICESFLDLLQCNPQSRIQNPNNHFKSIQNLKLNLAIALLRMAPNRFQTNFKKIYHGIQSSDNSQLAKRSIQALYILLIKRAKITSLNDFLKKNDRTSIVYPIPDKKPQKKDLFKRAKSLKAKNPIVFQSLEYVKAQSSRVSEKDTAQNQQFNDLRQTIKRQQSYQQTLSQSQVYINKNQLHSESNILQIKLDPQSSKKNFLKVQQFKMIGINRLRSSVGSQIKQGRNKGVDQYNFRNSKPVKIRFAQFPQIDQLKAKSFIRVIPMLCDSKLTFKKNLSKQYFNDQQ